MITSHNRVSFVMNDDQGSRKPEKYADSSISDKAFKRMILWFFLYCAFFCICVIFVVNADSAFMP
jgi:Trk-type K+ transport system membrane component